MEAKYYLIEQLVEMCEKALEKKKEEHDPICRVPLITSAKEERQLVTGKKVKKKQLIKNVSGHLQMLSPVVGGGTQHMGRLCPGSSILL